MPPVRPLPFRTLALFALAPCLLASPSPAVEEAVPASFEPFAESQVYRPPQIAIVFDDLGYSTRGMAGEILDLPARITFAVLPDLRYSEAFAESALARGHEVILHVPMEPLDTGRHDPGDDALFVELAPAENLRRLRRHFGALPYFTGVSNHMGSRATADPAVMETVLREVRDRDHCLYFLDSSTTPHSVAGESARVLGVPCLRNNLFLDGGGSVAAVGQTRLLADIALERGHAIAIGHVRRDTLDAVRAAIPLWRAAGIRLVALSDLMHRDASEVSTR